MAEISSVETLLDAAGERALSEHELSEVKRILYGNPSKWVKTAYMQEWGACKVKKT